MDMKNMTKKEVLGLCLKQYQWMLDHKATKAKYFRFDVFFPVHACYCCEYVDQKYPSKTVRRECSKCPLYEDFIGHVPCIKQPNPYRLYDAVKRGVYPGAQYRKMLCIAVSDMVNFIKEKLEEEGE